MIPAKLSASPILTRHTVNFLANCQVYQNLGYTGPECRRELSWHSSVSSTFLSLFSILKNYLFSKSSEVSESADI